MPDEIFKKVKVHPNTQEYQEVAQGFLRTANQYTICNVSNAHTQRAVMIFIVYQTAERGSPVRFVSDVRLSACRTSTCGRPLHCARSASLPRTARQSSGRGCSTTARQRSRAAASRRTDLTGATQEHTVRSAVTHQSLLQSPAHKAKFSVF